MRPRPWPTAIVAATLVMLAVVGVRTRIDLARLNAIADRNTTSRSVDAGSELHSTVAAARTERIATTSVQVLLLTGLAVLAILQLRARDRAAAEIFAEREHLRVTINSIGDGVIATDTRGRITIMNGVAESLTEWSATEAFGRDVHDVFTIVNEETRRTVANPIDRALSEGTAQGLANHTILVGRNGSERPIDDSGAPICGADGTVRGAILVFRDISAQRRSEKALRDSERRYRDAAAAANEANAVKDNFLALLSHELRTPLNAMLGWTQMIRNGAAQGATMDRAIAAIERNAAMQLRLVEELLDLSRIVTGKFNLNRQPVDIGATVAGALDAIRSTLAGRSLTIDLPTDGPLTMLGDSVRLQQVVSNIVGNAIKFTEPGATISVRLVRDGWRVELTISDNGPGISPDVLPHVFERYRQGRSAPLSSGGLGLGLAIVRRIVEAHGGGIRAESEPGRGATFTITLPLMTRTDAVFSSDDAALLQATGSLTSDDAQRRTEVSLRTLAAVIENSHDFIGVCNPAFEPIFVNTAGRRMVGIDPEADVRALPVRSFFMPDDLPLIDREAIPTLLSTGRWTGLVRFRHFKTGEPIHTMWNAFMIRDETGAVVAIATISPDLGKLNGLAFTRT